jgi:magnesium-transporting ATPase (P-type)
MIILTVSATVSLVLGLIPPEWLGEEKANSDWIEAIAIYVTIIIVATVTAGNNYTKDKQFRELNKAKHNFPVKVIRGGIESQILNFDVLVGDLVILDTGDQVPADGFYVSGFGMLWWLSAGHWRNKREVFCQFGNPAPFVV